MVFRTMIAELQQRAFDDAWSEDFPPVGRFVSVKVDDRKYWYFDQPNGEGGQKRKYVGPADDPDITARVGDFKREKADYKGRRKIVSVLTRDAGLIAPEPFTGDVVEALAKAGLFRLRGILVGTVAFQCYSSYLGVRLPMASILTGDADIAQDYAILAEVSDTLPTILNLLQDLDPSFRAVPHISGSPRSNAFRNLAGYRVEFLTTNRGSEEYADEPVKVPALGGASAEPLRFMDFLIRDPVRSILLYGPGITVVVPSPERYAVHKMIIAGQRQNDAGGEAKRQKDIKQAEILLLGMRQFYRRDLVAAAFGEAWERGPSWQAAIIEGIGMMTEEAQLVTQFNLKHGREMFASLEARERHGLGRDED